MNINVEQLTTEEKENVVARNKELIELIKYDPKNKRIYTQELVTNNIPLVFLMCKKKILNRPFDEDDFQTGVMGLIKAANTFDPDKKVTFASYACFLIERELVDAFKASMGWFDNVFTSEGGRIVALDDMLTMEDQMSTAESIADELASLDFLQLLDDFQLTRIFEEVINPILDRYCESATTARTYDPELWKKLEATLLLDMIEVDTLKDRMTATKIAKELGISVTNVRNKHDNVLKRIKAELIAKKFVILK